MSKKKWNTLRVIIILVAVVLVIDNVVLKIAENNERNIKNYEESVIDKYSDGGVLKSEDDRQEVLDEIEEYFKIHKRKYFIIKIERDIQSVTLKFLYGSDYMIWPSVKGIK